MAQRATEASFPRRRGRRLPSTNLLKAFSDRRRLKRHYSHYGYIAEQLEAFEAWAAHVQAVAIGGGVVALR